MGNDVGRVGLISLSEAVTIGEHVEKIVGMDRLIRALPIVVEECTTRLGRRVTGA